MMGCAGNPHLDTPALDRLAAESVRFERAYCTNPVCVPSRFSLMTGQMPSEINLRSNDDSHIMSIPDHITHSGLGHIMKNAGYDVAYAGKQHLPKMHAEDLGFDVITKDERDELATTCADHIQQERDKPFFLVASFINPHDICYMAIREHAEVESSKRILENGKTEVATLEEALRLPEGATDAMLPPLPPNYEPQQDEPEIIQALLEQRPFKKNARNNWSDRQWRLHRWAYCRLTERVDRQIGVVLDALRKSGKDRDTLIIFSSDHGDLDGAHRLEHKTAFYEEACRIPLLVRPAGGLPGGRVDRTHLVSNGLDLLPTLCDYAGAMVPDGRIGQSIRPLVEEQTPEFWRTHIPVESEFGRMIISNNFKYMLYDEGENHEQLIDLQKDPGEMRNALSDPDLADIVQHHRVLFARHYSGTNNILTGHS